jgi:lipopolysaccharide heptosyltransferase II
MKQMSALNEINPRRIFVFLREHIGDIVNSTPALHCLRQRFPDAYLCVEVGDRAAGVLQNLPGIDEVWLRPKHQGLWGKIRFIWRLKRARFDLAVVLELHNDMAFHAWLAGIPVRVGVSRKRKFERFYTGVVRHSLTEHDTLDHYRKVVELLGCDTTDYRPRLYPTEADERHALQLLREAGYTGARPLIGINPGASYPHRRWFPERFGQLVDALQQHGCDSVILGSPEDRHLTERILSSCQHAPMVLTGKLSILQLAALMPHLSLLVTADTGPMHIAAAMGTRVLALYYGAAHPRHTGPFGNGHRIIRHPEPCEGCTQERCLHDNECMRRIRVEEVSQAVLQMLNGE